MEARMPAAAPIDPETLDALLCPVCAGAFAAVAPSPGAPAAGAAAPGAAAVPTAAAAPGAAAAHGRGLVCSEGHRFDAAKQGYISLLTGRGTRFTSDTAAMVTARQAFLDAGHYAPLAAALARSAVEALAGVRAPLVLDAGAGTGYYLGRVRTELEHSHAIALDISKYALRRLAHNAPGALGLAWDIWRPLPVAARSIDLLLNVFAPRNPAEFARVLHEKGTLLVVTPLPGHLAELRRLTPILDIAEDKAGRMAATLEPQFSAVGYDDLDFTMRLSPADAAHAVLMGPAAHHLDASAVGDDLADVPDGLDVTAAFRISRFRRSARSSPDGKNRA